MEAIIKEGYDDFNNGNNVCPYRKIRSMEKQWWDEGWLKAFDEKIKKANYAL